MNTYRYLLPVFALTMAGCVVTTHDMFVLYSARCVAYVYKRISWTEHNTINNSMFEVNLRKYRKKCLLNRNI